MVKQQKSPLILELLLLLLILCLAGYFRILHLDSYPGLYNDEGTQINIAMNMLQGKTEYLGVQDSLLLFMRMPLYPFLLSIIFRFVSPGLEAVRIFSASLGLLTIALVFFISRDLFDKKGATIGLLAALALAIYPKFVMYNRIGISYNLLTPLVLVHFWGLSKYWQTRKISWMILAGAAIGVGGLVDLISFTLVPGFLLVLFLIRKRDVLSGLGLVGLPFVIYGVSRLIASPQAFLFDLQFFAFRASGDSLLVQLGTMILNIGTFLTREGWVILGFCGLFLLTSLEIRGIAMLVLLLPIMIISRTINFNIGFYYLVPLMPILSIGVGRFVERAVVQIMQTFQPLMKNWLSKIRFLGHGRERTRHILTAVVPTLFVFSLVITPVFVLIFTLDNQIRFHAPHQILNYSDDIRGARQVQEYINNHIHEKDVILASPAIAWMLNGRASDYQIALAASGIKTIHLPPIPAERLTFPISFQTARYVVVDAIWLDWAETEMLELVDIRKNMKKSWALVLEAGRYSVYENPAPDL